MRVLKVALGVMFLFVLLGSISGEGTDSFASNKLSHRQTEISVSYTQYEWWLMRWLDNEFMCQVFADHDGLPSAAEVLAACDGDIYRQWLATGPCLALDKDGSTQSCPGLYMHFIASEPKSRKIVIDLPEPSVRVTLLGCPPKPLNNLCTSMPALLFLAEEPLPNQYPVAVHGAIGGEPFACAAPVCKLPLRPTAPEGTLVDFWMDSSYGDSSQRYQAKVRVVDASTASSGAQAGYFVDILSTQWRGNENASGCSECWQAFPVVGEAVDWLANPKSEDELTTNNPLVYLAGRLIASGVVQASDCPAGGLMLNGWASACGLDKARQSVAEWQNRFNEQILQTSQDTGIPSRLLKNLLAQESQFWPGTVEDQQVQEYGLGRLTELGSDSLLLLNRDFYNKFCPLVLDQSVCDSGYLGLSMEQQAMLRGALAVSVRSDCATCPAGVDFTHANFNVKLVAETLKANCEQTGAIVTSVTGKAPGDAAPYEDLWRFTLTSYHAGPGCLMNALQTTWQAREPLRWDRVSTHLQPACQSAINFVERVSHPGVYFNQPLPTAPADVLTLTAAVTLTPAITQATPTPTPQPSSTPTPTSTPQAPDQILTEMPPDLQPTSEPPGSQPTATITLDIEEPPLTPQGTYAPNTPVIDEGVSDVPFNIFLTPVPK